MAAACNSNIPFFTTCAAKVGIRRARGKFIMLTDSDSMLPLPSLRALLEVLDRSEEKAPSGSSWELGEVHLEETRIVGTANPDAPPLINPIMPIFAINDFPKSALDKKHVNEMISLVSQKSHLKVEIFLVIGFI